MKKYIPYLSLLLVVAIIFASCEDTSNCNATRNRSVRVFFMKYNNKKVLIDTTLQYINVIGNNNKYYTANNTSNASFYLNVFSDTTIYYIKADSSITYAIADTIRIFVSKELEMVSSACGFNYAYTILSGRYTSYLIDTVIVKDKKVNVDIEKNLTIVLKRIPSKTSKLQSF